VENLNSITMLNMVIDLRITISDLQRFYKYLDIKYKLYETVKVGQDIEVYIFDEKHYAIVDYHDDYVILVSLNEEEKEELNKIIRYLRKLSVVM